MASKNPLMGSFVADNEMPAAEPHHRRMGMHSHPMHHPHKTQHMGRPMVEMPRGHGARMSATDRDMHMSSSRGAKLPGMKEPSGIQRIASGRGVPGNMFGGGTPGAMKAPNRTVKTGSMNSDKRVGVPGNKSPAKHMGKGMSDKAMGPVRPVR